MSSERTIGFTRICAVFLIHEDSRIPLPLYVDACTTSCGAVTTTHTYYVAFPTHILQQHLSICHWEALITMIAVKVWAPMFAKQLVHLFSDNTMVVAIFFRQAKAEIPLAPITTDSCQSTRVQSLGSTSVTWFHTSQGDSCHIWSFVSPTVSLYYNIIYICTHVLELPYIQCFTMGVLASVQLRAMSTFYLIVHNCITLLGLLTSMYLCQLLPRWNYSDSSWTYPVTLVNPSPPWYLVTKNSQFISRFWQLSPLAVHSNFTVNLSSTANYTHLFMWHSIILGQRSNITKFSLLSPACAEFYYV